jgi:hypothetical protein
MSKSSPKRDAHTPTEKELPVEKVRDFLHDTSQSVLSE